MYFDIYGALIDSESGIFAALEPLLARCFRRFDRAEALSFYFESESEMKRRTPTARYPEILAQAHKDISMRLGLTSSNKETSQFASSILHWPLFDGAVQCLQTLYHQIPTLVALVDMDHDTFTQTASYPLISPYFAEMFTWDATHSYRPDLATFAAPFSYHDAGDVPRKRRCLVSGRLFRDLEVAYVASILGIWMWHPTTSLRKEEGSFVWEVCEGLTDLVSVIIRAKARCHDM
ncbi:HAD-like domain-containing protein [Mycena epipterygia]|nr:HAD-like domain-containing protein [Mycena epipterygia]